MEALGRALCCALVGLMIAPISLVADDGPAAAMVYARGTAWVNGASVPRSLAIFPGDLVETRSDSAANINAAGSTVTVLSDSLVKLQSSGLELKHGAVTVGTSKLLAIDIADIVVSPVSGHWTEFQVGDVDGTVKIVASKGDLSIRDQEGTTTLPAGQQTTREESKKKKKRREGGAVAAAKGGILDSKAAVIVGTAAVGGVTAWVLLQGDDPVSPAKP